MYFLDNLLPLSNAPTYVQNFHNKAGVCVERTQPETAGTILSSCEFLHSAVHQNKARTTQELVMFLNSPESRTNSSQPFGENLSARCQIWAQTPLTDTLLF